MRTEVDHAFQFRARGRHATAEPLWVERVHDNSYEELHCLACLIARSFACVPACVLADWQSDESGEAESLHPHPVKN